MSDLIATRRLRSPEAVHSIRPTRLSSAAAAAFLGVSPKTLSNWRARDVGPRFVRAGKKGGALYYLRSDLERFVAEQADDAPSTTPSSTDVAELSKRLSAAAEGRSDDAEIRRFWVDMQLQLRIRAAIPLPEGIGIVVTEENSLHGLDLWVVTWDEWAELFLDYSHDDGAGTAARAA